VSQGKLAALLDQKHRADIAYHQNDDPIMSDGEYDALCREIVALGGELTTVGAAPSSSFEKVSHRVRMGSLDNAFTEEDVAKFVKDTKADTYLAQHKMDGLSLSLTYEGGKLIRAVTRGDGETGENVTAGAKYLNIPLTIPTEELTEVRGEVYMPRDHFFEINRQLRCRWQEALRQLPQRCSRIAPPEEGSRGQGARPAFSRLTASPPIPCRNWTATSSSLNNLFTGASRRSRPKSVTAVTTCSVASSDRPRTPALQHDIDGVVYKVDSRHARKTLGETSRTPRWGVAHKFPAEKAYAGC
jgi:DNA ligase (NAD+)